MASSSYFCSEDLLALEQSDLNRSTTKRFVLTSLPLEVLLPGKNNDSNHHQQTYFVANDESASLITPTSSYSLTTVDTSNCLVIWPKASKAKNRNSKIEVAETGAAPSPSNKRHCSLKPVTWTRLVQPGGSGASFLSGTPKTLLAADVLPFLRQDRTKTSSSPYHKKNNSRNGGYSTRQMANLLQVADSQVEQVLSQLSCILIKDNKITENYPQDSSYYWQLLDEDTIFQARAAVVSTACEEDTAQLATTTELEDQVAKRLQGTPYAMEVARKFVLLASSSPTKNQQEPSNDLGNELSFDSQTVALWVCQDMLRQQSKWDMTAFLETCQSRLPFGDAYEGLVTREWLLDQKGKGFTMDDNEVSLSL